MYNVPSVTMNGGSRKRVTQHAVEQPAGRADTRSREQQRERPGRP